MTTHTPGPWFIGRHPRNVVGLIEGDEEIVATIGDMPCIRGHDDLAAERGADMEAANARLIAAAPELLEALCGLLSVYAKPDRAMCCDGRECGCMGASVYQEAEHYARAAIAKATGDNA